MTKTSGIKPWLRYVLMALPIPYLFGALITYFSASQPGWLNMVESIFLVPTLSIMVTSYWLWNRSRRLRFRSGGDGRILPFVALVMTWWMTNIMLQLALYSYWGKVVQAENADQVMAESQAVYYTLKNFEPDTTLLISNVEVRSAQRGGSPQWEFYFALGLKDSDGLNNQSVWVGKSYKRSIPRGADREQKDAIFKEKYQDCLGRFIKTVSDTAEYYKRIDFKTVLLGYQKGILNRYPDYKGSIKDIIILEPQPGDLASRKDEPLLSISISMALMFFSLILWLTGKKRVWSLEPIPPSPKAIRLPGSRRPRLPWEKGFVWQFLALCMFVLFLIIGIKGGNLSTFLTSDLVEWGALYEPAVQNGEIWRMFTAIFLHNGLVHLGTNMIVLYLLYRVLENYMPDLLFLLFFLATGLIASLASIWINDPALSVGASGALMGLTGVAIAMRLLGELKQDRAAIYFGFLMLFTLSTLLMGSERGADVAAHLGGLGGGFILGLPFALLRKKPSD